jgi:hypothetical protein
MDAVNGLGLVSIDVGSVPSNDSLKERCLRRIARLPLAAAHRAFRLGVWSAG